MCRVLVQVQYSRVSVGMLLSKAKIADKPGLASIIQETTAHAHTAATAVMNQNGSEGDAQIEEVADSDAGAGEGEDDELQSVNGEKARKRSRQQEDNSAGDSRKTAKPNKVAYSAAEAAGFSKDIVAMNGKDDQRLKCAADDVICAVNFVFDSEFSNYDRESSSQAIMNAKAMCFSLWCEFLLAGRLGV